MYINSFLLIFFNIVVIVFLKAKSSLKDLFLYKLKTYLYINLILFVIKNRYSKYIKLFI